MLCNRLRGGITRQHHLALNHIAPFLLTNLLLDLIKASPAGRIVTVSSEFHSGELDFKNLQGQRHYSPLRAHNRSKLCNILFTYELARHLSGTRVTANCASPGRTITRLGNNVRGLSGGVVRLMKYVRFSYPERGAQTPVYVASSPEVELISGRFFLNCRETRTKEITYDLRVAERLWRVTEALCERSEGLTENDES